MDRSTAERAVITSALIVAGIYAYRRITEPSSPPATLKKLAGIGELPPLGAWATAWGFTFLVVSVIAEISPALGGSFAILIATGDVLTNTSNVVADVGKAEKGAGVPTSPTPAATTAAGQNLSVIAGAAGTTAAQAGTADVAGAALTGLGDIGAAAIP